MMNMEAQNMTNTFLGKPVTKIGWWAVGLAIASLLLVPAWSVRRHV
jgi:hypothetical protein